MHTSELTDFVVDLAKPSNPIPKPYVLAVEAEPIPLAEIASTVSASVGTGGTVMMDADAFTDAVMDMPELALLQVDLPLSMGKSIFATFTKSSSRAGFVAAASGATKDEFLTSRGVGPSRVVLAGMHGALMDNVAGLVQAKYNVPLVALADGVAYLQEQGQAWEAKQEALTAATAAAEENSEDAEAAAALAAAQEAVAVVPGWLTLYEELKVATEPQGKAKEVPCPLTRSLTHPSSSLSPPPRPSLPCPALLFRTCPGCRTVRTRQQPTTLLGRTRLDHRRPFTP